MKNFDKYDKLSSNLNDKEKYVVHIKLKKTFNKILGLLNLINLLG